MYIVLEVFMKIPFFLNFVNLILVDILLPTTSTARPLDLCDKTFNFISYFNTFVSFCFFQA